MGCDRMSGCFIVFDGIDGCGKSTQIERAVKRLERDGCMVVVTREPGGTAIAEKIREIILSPEQVEMYAECELLLYGAARAQHVREKIIPSLKKGAVVLCDRFDLATFAYQGFGRSLSMPLLEKINTIATGGLAPDLTFVFDIDVSTAMQRLSTMNKNRDRMENEDGAFFGRVANGYRTLAAQNPRTVVLLDATEAIDELEDTVYQRIVSIRDR
jgi:dTMP kinase